MVGAAPLSRLVVVVALPCDSALWVTKKKIKEKQM
jgi:hypothetical protein